MRVFVTGGHLTPALAFIDYALEHDPDFWCLFVGRTYSMPSVQQKAREATEMKQRKIPFVPINVPRLGGLNPIRWMTRTPIYIWSIMVSLWLILKHKPQVLVSFGGYLAVPVSIACWLLGVKIITHEQTSVAGSANLFISTLATKVAISFPSSAQYFPKKKTVLTGNPIRPTVLLENPKRPAWFTSKKNKPVLLVSGGNQGSYMINTTIQQVLPQLLRKYVVIHACGRSTNQLNYKQELLKTRRRLSPTHQDGYFVREWISGEDYNWVLRQSELAVARSGANTVHELLIHQLPSILIPLPFSNNDEQQKNARYLSRLGGAKTISQKSLTPTKLLKTVDDVYAKRKSMRRKLANAEPIIDGTERFFQLVSQVLA